MRAKGLLCLIILFLPTHLSPIKLITMKLSYSYNLLYSEKISMLNPLLKGQRGYHKVVLYVVFFKHFHAYNFQTCSSAH
jgi:hypothetical protein